MTSLKQKTLLGIKWSVGNKVLQKAISIVTFAILARILKPADFGLFALAFVAIDSLAIFKSFGIDSALVQRKENVDEAIQTGFFITTISGAVIACAGWIAAPFVAKFFDRGDLLWVIRALTLTYFFTYVSKIPFAYLEKSMRFAVSNAIDFIGSITNSTFAVLFALISPSVWSLVAAYLLRQVVMGVLSWYWSGIRIRLYFNWKIAGELFNFGKFMTALGILWYIGSNVDNIVIGKLLGATMLGYYAIANNVGNFINSHFTVLVSNVMFPAYSSIQNDSEAFKRVYLKTVKFVSMLSVPFGLGLIFLAKEFVLTLYGARWVSVIPLIRLFGCVQLIAPIKACSSPVFMARGRPDYTFNLSFFYLLLRVPLLIFMTRLWGLNGTVISELISIALFAPINLTLAKKLVGCSYREIFRQITSSVCCSLIMVGTISLLRAIFAFSPVVFITDHNYVQFGVLAVSGLTAYALGWLVIDRAAALEVRHMVLKESQR